MRNRAALGAVLVLAACGGPGEGPREESLARGAAEASADYAIVPQGAPAAGMDLGKRGAADARQQAGAVVSGTTVADSLRAPMLIRNGSARVEVAELDSAVAAVYALAARLGGYVANVSMQLGARQVREAMLTLRIPAAQFERALGGLEPLGDVEAVDVSTEDVGELYTDLERRLATARRLEERLLELLATRTGELEDVLAVERELARVREEAERIEGHLRSLRRRVDMSTLIETVHEPAPLLSQYPGENLLLRSVRQAGRNFLNLLGGFIASLGVLIPAALVVWAAWALLRRRRRARQPVTVDEGAGPA